MRSTEINNLWLNWKLLKCRLAFRNIQKWTLQRWSKNAQDRSETGAACLPHVMIIKLDTLALLSMPCLPKLELRWFFPRPPLKRGGETTFNSYIWENGMFGHFDRDCQEGVPLSLCLSDTWNEEKLLKGFQLCDKNNLIQSFEMSPHLICLGWHFNFHIISRSDPEAGHEMGCQLRHIKGGLIFKL